MTWRALLLVGAVVFALGSAGCGSDLPVKPADFLQVRPPGKAISPPNDAVRLSIEDALALGPRIGIAAEWVLAAEEVTAEDAPRLEFGQGMRAADGHEFLFVRLADDARYVEGRWGRRGQVRSGLKAQVTVDGQTRALNAVPEPGSVVVVSVPAGKPAKLTVVDEQRPMSIDLRSGKPAGGLGKIPRHKLNGEYDEAGRLSTPAGARSLDVEIGIDEVTLEPYLPGLGWAKAGRGWLRLSLNQVSSDAVLQSSSDEPAVGFFVDPAKTFELTVAGATYRPKAGLAYNTMRPAARYLAVIDVPAALRAATLRIRPDGPLFMYRGSSTLSHYTNLKRVPDCGPRLRAICLEWSSRPDPQVIGLALK